MKFVFSDFFRAVKSIRQLNFHVNLRSFKFIPCFIILSLMAPKISHFNPFNFNRPRLDQDCLICGIKRIQYFEKMFF